MGITVPGGSISPTGVASSGATSYPGGIIDAVMQASVVSAATLTSGRVFRAVFRSPESRNVTTFVTRTRGTAAGATPTLCRIGLETVSINPTGNAVFTLVARTDNTTALWASVFTRYDTPMSSAGGYVSNYNLVAGQLYCVTALCVTGATPPALYGTLGAMPTTGNPLYHPQSSTSQLGQTDIPASWTIGYAYQPFDGGVVPYLGIY